MNELQEDPGDGNSPWANFGERNGVAIKEVQYTGVKIGMDEGPMRYDRKRRNYNLADVGHTTSGFCMYFTL